jgi:hypothetical protein
VQHVESVIAGQAGVAWLSVNSSAPTGSFIDLISNKVYFHWAANAVERRMNSDLLPHSHGRFISWERLKTLKSWPMSSKAFCLRDLPDSSLPADYFVISHAWAEKWHPDPDGTKLKTLLDCHDAAAALRARIGGFSANEIDRQMEAQLLKEFRCSLVVADAGRVLEASPFYDFVGRSSAELIQWMRDALDRALNAPVWIDSYALPIQAHRNECGFCRQNHNDFLFRIPRLISKGTCHVPSIAEPRDLRRGWVILEQIIAISAGSIAISAEYADMTSWMNRIFQARARFLMADYTCGTISDGTYLPLLMALERVRHLCLDTQAQNQVIKGSADAHEKLVNWAKAALRFGEQRQGEFLDRVDVILFYASDPRFMDLCKGIGVFWPKVGNVALSAITYTICGALVSFCWRFGILLKHGSLETLVQACVYKYVCKDRSSSTAEKIGIALQHFLQARILSEEVPMEEEDERDVLSIYRFWMEGNRMDVDPGLFPLWERGRYETPGLDEEEASNAGAPASAVFEPVDPNPDIAVESLRPVKRVAKRVRSDAERNELFSEDGIPGDGLMRKLPSWAAVAFAARCFRRVQPLLARYWPEVPEGALVAMEALVSISEQEPKHSLVTMDSFINAVNAVARVANPFMRSMEMPAAALKWGQCYSILSVAISVGYTQKSALAGTNGITAVAKNAVDASWHMCQAVDASYRMVEDIRSDFAAILHACEENGWRHLNLSPLFFFVNGPPLEFVDYSIPEE